MKSGSTKLEKLRQILNHESSEIDSLGRFLINLEEVTKIITSQEFMKKLSLILNKEIKEKLLRFLGSLILVGKNSTEYLDLLKKFHRMPFSMFSNSEAANCLTSCDYQEEKLFTLYHHARMYENVPESPTLCSTPANTNRLSLRLKTTYQRFEDKDGDEDA